MEDPKVVPKVPKAAPKSVFGVQSAQAPCAEFAMFFKLEHEMELAASSAVPAPEKQVDSVQEEPTGAPWRQQDAVSQSAHLSSSAALWTKGLGFVAARARTHCRVLPT